MWRSIIDGWKGLVPGQQISVVILGACGMLAFGLSAYRIHQNIYAPFMVDKGLLAQAKQVVGVTEDQVVEQQKRRDTDGDGLSDWDETNRYHTNPNLYDTCGDGIPDNIRVATGKNMNCSETGANVAGRLDLKIVNAAPVAGQIGAIPNAGDVPLFDQKFFQDMAALGPSLGASGTELMGDGAGKAPSEARDPAFIRNALRDRVDPAILDKVTDEQLLKMFDAAVAKQAGVAPASSTPGSVQP